MVLELVQCGFFVVLLEVYWIGWGVSGCNGGQLICGVGYDVEQFFLVIGVDGVKVFKLMGLEVVEIVCCWVEQYVIDCDLCWGYCDLVNKFGDYQGFCEDMEEFQVFGYCYEMCLVLVVEMCSVVGFDCYVGGLVDMGFGYLYLFNLVFGEVVVVQLLGVCLFECLLVMWIDYGMEVQVYIVIGKVWVKILVLGCNVYMNDFNLLFGGKVLLVGSYVIVIELLDEKLVC